MIKKNNQNGWLRYKHYKQQTVAINLPNYNCVGFSKTTFSFEKFNNKDNASP